MHPIIVSQVKDDKFNSDVKPFSTFKDDGSTHRVRFSIAHSSSTEASKCLKFRDTKTGALSNATKGAVPKGKELVLCMQFLAKDSSQLGSNHFTKVNLVDSGSFFAFKPKDVQGDEGKLRSAVQMLERFNVWVEAVVLWKNGQFSITDATSLKKYD